MTCRDKLVTGLSGAISELLEVKHDRFTANGKMKFPSCENTEKFDLIKLFPFLSTRYIE